MTQTPYSMPAPGLIGHVDPRSREHSTEDYSPLGMAQSEIERLRAENRELRAELAEARR